ncbi:hypothetical protein V1282_000204 [Nitrobacteraceae bacterium AZCC 2146]|jgi:hypothetical protein
MKLVSILIGISLSFYLADKLYSDGRVIDKAQIMGRQIAANFGW